MALILSFMCDGGSKPSGFQIKTAHELSAAVLATQANSPDPHIDTDQENY